MKIVEPGADSKIEIKPMDKDRPMAQIAKGETVGPSILERVRSLLAVEAEHGSAP